VKEVFISLLTTAVIQLLTMASGMLTARWLLPQGKGELTTALLWPSMLVALGSLGIQDAVAFGAANTEEEKIKRVFASGLYVSLFLSIFLVSLGYLILPVILSNHTTELIDMSRLYLWYIPPTMVTFCFTGLLLGKLRIKEVNLLRVSVYVTILSLVIAFYLLSKISVLNFTLAFLVSSWVSFALSILFIKRNWIGLLPSLLEFKKLLAYGIKVHVGSVAGMLNLRLDQLLLSIFLPPAELGLYVVAVTVGSAASMAATTIGYWVAFPRLANLSSGSFKAQTFGRFMRLAMVTSLLSAVILFAGLPWIINFFFGASYDGSVGMARILILAAIPLGCNAIFTAGLKSYNLPAVSSKGEVVGLVVTAIALFALLPKFQALGAAWASLLAYFATFVYMLRQTCQHMKVRSVELFLPESSDWNYVRSFLARIRLSISKLTVQKW